MPTYSAMPASPVEGLTLPALLPVPLPVPVPPPEDVPAVAVLITNGEKLEVWKQMPHSV